MYAEFLNGFSPQYLLFGRVTHFLIGLALQKKQSSKNTSPPVTPEYARFYEKRSLSDCLQQVRSQKGV